MLRTALLGSPEFMEMDRTSDASAISIAKEMAGIIIHRMAVRIVTVFLMSSGSVVGCWLSVG